MTKQEFTIKYTDFLNKHAGKVLMGILIFSIGAIFCELIVYVIDTYALLNSLFYFTWYKKYYKKG